MPIRTALAVALALIPAGATLAQGPNLQAASPALSPNDDSVSELVVVARPQGPAVWKLQVGQSSMVILGSVTPLHHQQQWDQRQVAAALDGARLLLTPPKPELGPAQVIGLVMGNVWKVRQSRPVEELMTPDLRDRFVSHRTQLHQKADRYAHWKPAVAGFLMLSDFRRYVGLSEGKPGTTVEKMARAAHTPVQPVGVVRVSLLMKVASGLNDQQNLQCLRSALDQLEYEVDHAQDLDGAWARGDVLSVNARYRVSALQRCLMLAPGADRVVEDEMARTTDRLWAELHKPGKTVAVVDLAWLLPQGGLLDRLKARGAQVGPPPALAANAPAAAQMQ